MADRGPARRPADRARSAGRGGRDVVDGDYLTVENWNTVVELNGVPGFNVVVGKFGWLGEFG
jgi:hypothetical protein